MKNETKIAVLKVVKNFAYFALGFCLVKLFISFGWL